MDTATHTRPRRRTMILSSIVCYCGALDRKKWEERTPAKDKDY